MTRRARGLGSGVTLRRGSSADDASCGLITGRALAAGPVPRALPFASEVLTSTAPLPLLPGRRRLLAWQDGLPVGFADLHREAAVLSYLFVLPEAQGQGIGSLLLASVERAVDQPLTLTVLAANTPACAFYARHGYTEIERWRQDDWHGGPVDWLRLQGARNR